MPFCLNMCISMTKGLAVFRNSCLHSLELGLKGKNRLLEEERVFSEVLIELKCTWLDTGLTVLNKQQIYEMLRVEFLRIKISHFRIF